MGNCATKDVEPPSDVVSNNQRDGTDFPPRRAARAAKYTDSPPASPMDHGSPVHGWWNDESMAESPWRDAAAAVDFVPLSLEPAADQLVAREALALVPPPDALSVCSDGVLRMCHFEAVGKESPRDHVDAWLSTMDLTVTPSAVTPALADSGYDNCDYPGAVPGPADGDDDM
jgi:hypothetical protein